MYSSLCIFLQSLVTSPFLGPNVLSFQVRHPRGVSNKSKCNVCTICRQTQLSTRWYANLLNVNLNNYMFRPCQPRGLVVRASDY